MFAKVHYSLSLEAEAPEIQRFPDTDEIDECPADDVEYHACYKLASGEPC